MNGQLHSIVILGAGFIGQQITGHCLIQGKHVRIYDANPPQQFHLRTVEYLISLSTDPAKQSRRRNLLNSATITSDAETAA